MRIDEFEFRNKQGEEIEPTKEQLVVYIKGLHKQVKEQKERLKAYKNAIKSRNDKLKNKNEEIAKLKDDLEQKTDAFACLQYTCARDVTRAKNELLDIKYQKANLEYNWNALCDYLGECIVRYENVDENGIYKEVLDAVNKIKHYNPKSQENKVYFAITELEKVREFVDGRTFLATYINNRIKELKEIKNDN